MGFFDRFKKPAAPAAPAKPAPVSMKVAPNTVCAPLSGQAVALADAPDEIFANGVLGKGIVIKPSSHTVHAPFSGTVEAMMGHAVGLKSPDGIDLLVHIGVDTVEMEGEGFTCHVAQGDTVEAGEALITFDPAAVKAAGHPDDVMVLISNTADYASVDAIDPQPVSAGDPVVTVSM